MGVKCLETLRFLAVLEVDPTPLPPLGTPLIIMSPSSMREGL